MNLWYYPEIYVWMPSWTGFPHPETILNIFNQTCVKNREVELVFYSENIIKRKPVQHARNEIVHNFLKSGCHYLWFVDDDNPPALDVLENLLEHQKDCVSALVPLRHWDNYLLNIFKDWKHITSYEWMEWPLIEIDNFWTWCVLMSKDIVEAMYKKFNWNPYQFRIEEFVLNEMNDEVERYEFQDRYIQDWFIRYKQDEFWNILKREESISEDLFFGREAKKLWFKFYADLRSHCTHFKDITKLKVKYEEYKTNLEYSDSNTTPEEWEVNWIY